MNHQCQTGCFGAGFVPVDSNWDFNMDRTNCSQRRSCTKEAAPRQAEACPCQERTRPACEEPAAPVQTVRHADCPAMVSVDMQQLGAFYQPENALKAGTLYATLHKPMRGYAPCETSCGDAQQAIAFTLWELRLYLNTHPNDAEALGLFRRLCQEAGHPNYASTFLPHDANTWSWVQEPWPWEYSANGYCVKEDSHHVCV